MKYDYTGERETKAKQASRKDGRNNAGIVHLQGVGDVAGITAADLRCGDCLMWNYGGKSKVVSITPYGTMSVRVVEEYTTYDGEQKEHTRVMRASRIVAVLDTDGTYFVF